jgi:uncharacterized protein (TIGR03000 family)
MLETQGAVVVQLPADASLTVDGTQVPLTSETRTLVTPELKPGQDYHYTLRASANRDGQLVTRMKRVTVRAGAETVVDFGNLNTTATDAVSQARYRR